MKSQSVTVNSQTLLSLSNILPFVYADSPSTSVGPAEYEADPRELEAFAER